MNAQMRCCYDFCRNVSLATLALLNSARQIMERVKLNSTGSTPGTPVSSKHFDASPHHHWSQTEVRTLSSSATVDLCFVSEVSWFCSGCTVCEDIVLWHVYPMKLSLRTNILCKCCIFAVTCGSSRPRVGDQQRLKSESSVAFQMSGVKRRLLARILQSCPYIQSHNAKIAVVI